MTIVVDASALCAILFAEPDAERFARGLAASSPVIGAPSLLEASIAVAARHGPEGLAKLDALLAAATVRVIAFDDRHAALARDAYLRFGKARHPAGLNFGDCCAYAVAAAQGAPLLCKGDDFARTDLAPV